MSTSISGPACTAAPAGAHADDAAPPVRGYAVRFEPPGGDRPRLVLLYQGTAGYMSTGTVENVDGQRVPYLKDAGSACEILGAQETTHFTLSTDEDSHGNESVFILHPGWLIKGPGLTTNEDRLPKLRWDDVKFWFDPDAPPIRDSALLNQWIRDHGASAVGDADALLPDLIRVVPEGRRTR
jgi:hypothetical protein